MVVRAVPELIEIMLGAGEAHGLAVNDDRRDFEARNGFHNRRIAFGVIVPLFGL